MRAGKGLPVRSLALGYLALMVVLPVLSMGSTALEGGIGAFVKEALRPQALASIAVTVWLAGLATLVTLVAGLGIAWTLARREFFGKPLLDALIDLPLSIPAIVVGLMLLSLYGPQATVGQLLEQRGIEVLFSRLGIFVALLFVTLPLVVRTLQPVIDDLEPDVEAAAYTLGATRFEAFRRLTLPTLAPALGTGASLALARALGEFGALILIAGNVPFRTEVAPTYVYARIEMGRPQAAAAVALALLAASVLLLLSIEALQARLESRRSRGR